MSGVAPVPLLLADTAAAVREFAPHGFFILGVMFITAWLIMRIRKRSARRGTQPTARDQLERYRTRDAVRGDLEGLMVDIEQLARRLGAQLDAKSQQLETLLAEADQRIAALGGAVPPASGPVDRYEPEAAEPTPASTPPPPPAPVPAPEAPGRGPGAQGAAASLSDPQQPQPDPLVARVHVLSDTGRTPTEIAGDLNEPIGKVELILALRRSGHPG